MAKAKDYLSKQFWTDDFTEEEKAIMDKEIEK